MVLVTFLVSGCTDDARGRLSAFVQRAKSVVTPNTQSTPVQKLLDQLTSWDAIGMNIAYVQQVAGAAIRVDGDEHHYGLQECKLVLVVDAATQSIQSTKLDVSPACKLNVQRIVETNLPLPINELTFGKLQQVQGNGHFLADCLADCGNAYLPNVYWASSESRSSGGRQLVLSVPLALDQTLAAADQWRAPMRAHESEDWLTMQQGFNCPPYRYNDVATKAFSAIHPSYIQFGKSIELPQCTANTTEVPTASSTSSVTTVTAPTLTVPVPRESCDMEYGDYLKAQGLVPKAISIHGPEEPDFSGYGCPYRITPTPGTPVVKGSSVSFRSAWELQ